MKALLYGKMNTYATLEPSFDLNFRPPCSHGPNVGLACFMALHGRRIDECSTAIGDHQEAVVEDSSSTSQEQNASCHAIHPKSIQGQSVILTITRAQDKLTLHLYQVDQLVIPFLHQEARTCCSQLNLSPSFPKGICHLAQFTNISVTFKGVAMARNMTHMPG